MFIIELLEKLMEKSEEMNAYEAFLKIVEVGTFTEAAKQLGYTQSAVSQIVQTLEQQLETQLVIRSRKGISLTPDGEQFLPYIQNISYAERELRKKKAEMEGLDTGLVKIGALSSVACNMLPQAIKHFKKLYPAVQFEIRQGEYTDIEQWIEEGSVDFGFVNEKATERLTKHFLSADPLLVVLSPKASLASMDTLTLEMVAKEPLIVIDEGDSNHALALFEAASLRANCQYVVEEDFAAMALIEQQLGVAIMPSLMVERCPYDITTRMLQPFAVRQLYVAYKDFDILPVATRTFIMSLLEQFALE